MENKEPFTQANAILTFYKNLRLDFDLPDGISILNPFEQRSTWPLIESFYQTFYSDTKPRIFIFGINPGRFGGGITGIPFTDPIRLQQDCGIVNEFRKLPELSSVFIYQMIHAYGGAPIFYQDYFITAVSPLGYVSEGKNLNYYDDPRLLKACEPFVLNCIKLQLASILSRSCCICLGEGDNYKRLSRLNEKHGLFEKIIPLPHPRWIMQYRRKKISEFVELYLEKLRSIP